VSARAVVGVVSVVVSVMGPPCATAGGTTMTRDVTAVGFAAMGCFVEFGYAELIVVLLVLALAAAMGTGAVLLAG
jgi:hypothetical protein